MGKNEKQTTISLDFRSGLPIYTQIVEQIKEQVLRGDLQPEDQLPTVRKLSEQLRINFNTVARAYRMLDEAGLISTQQGRGTYITGKPDEKAARQLREQVLASLTRRFLAEAHRLGYSYNEVTTEIEIQKDGWNTPSINAELD